MKKTKGKAAAKEMAAMEKAAKNKPKPVKGKRK